ncbi:MAG: hypothetical protein JWP89_5728 [Schlesneria sp.]|nr:hypothetical protein [Schlesneria sp.]
MRRIHWRYCVQGLFAAAALSSGVALAGGPFPFTQAWYEERSNDPPGSRQIYKDGKYWPPYPRVQGPKQPFVQAYHSAHYWPHPYNCQDRADVTNLLEAQSGAGWAEATTLHDYHFDGDTQQLTDAGRSHLIWVLNTVPMQYRTVYVSQGVTAEMGQIRVATAQKFMQETGATNIPPIVAKYELFNGRPANEVDRIRTLELQSIPRPRLFLIGIAGRQGGGGGGGVSGGAGPSSGGGATGSSTGSTTTR